MSKRRNRDRQPNIPTETLLRAREQAGLPTTPAESEDEAAPLAAAAMSATRPVESLAPSAGAGAAVKRQRKVGSAQTGVKKRGENDQEKVKYLLEHPTRFVTEPELRAEYGHVLVDLRNMGLLAAVLIGMLIVLSRFI